MKKTNFLRKAAIFFAIMILFIAVQQARATTITVDMTADNPNATACTSAPSDCSLRGAVHKVNTFGSGIDRIDFALPSDDAGCTAQGVCTITLTNGMLSIIKGNATETVDIINSTGPSKLIISGNNQSPVFYNDKSSLRLGGITIANGKGATLTTYGFAGGFTTERLAGLSLSNCVVINNSGRTGGISAGGNVTISDSTIINNSGEYGGGVAVYGRLTIQRSTISGNTTTNNGGGVLLSGNAFEVSAFIENSTISGNMAINNGGGIFLSESSQITAVINSSTISGNTAASGGGIYTSQKTYLDYPSLSLYSSTVAENTATLASDGSNSGGIASVSNIFPEFPGLAAPMFLSNTIVAGNHNAIAYCSDMFAGLKTGSAYNLIGNGCLDNQSGETTNQIGTAANPIDPLLGPLADNGGPTMTHALLLGSPAIDKGKKVSANVSTDQRGLLRTVDLASISNAADGTDIGAYEVQTLPCPVITLSPSTLPDGYLGTFYDQIVSASGGSGSYTFSVTNGSLPSGLSLNESSGIISGTPDSTGGFSFTVTSADSNGCSGAQAYTMNINKPVIFNPPSDLRTDSVGTDFVNLSWTDNSNSETGFIVEMCSNRNCTSATQIGQTGANETTLSVTGLQPNKQYIFRVSAINGDGQKTAFSNTLTVKTLKR